VKPRPDRRPLTARWRAINRVRCGEHAFHVVQRLWGFTEGPLSGSREESRPCVDDVRARKPLTGAPSVAAGAGEVRPVSGEERAGLGTGGPRAAKTASVPAQSDSIS